MELFYKKIYYLLAIGRIHQRSFIKTVDPSCAWDLALILGVQIKMTMLIQQAEKKENSSSKKYEMSEWSFGYVILMTNWNTDHRHIALY